MIAAITLSGLESESADIFRLVAFFIVVAIVLAAIGHVSRERKR